MRMALYLILICSIAGLGWIRLAPSEPSRWHVDPQVSADQDLVDGVRRKMRLDEAGFADLQAVILNTPRTHVLAGGAQEGRVTYVTRSAWFGFPDYTTVQFEGGVAEIWARLRFGKSDLGVNKARVDGWLTEMRDQQEGA